MNVVKFHQIKSECPAEEQAPHTYHEAVYIIQTMLTFCLGLTSCTDHRECGSVV